MRLDPLPKGLMDAELERMLATQLEYEGWQEADTLYRQVHSALEGKDAKLRARALMDHAHVLRQVDKFDAAAALESQAESLVGSPIERDEAPKSSTDELKEKEARKPGLFGRLFGK